MSGEAAHDGVCPCSDAARLRLELDEARAQIAKLTETVRDQAKALAELTDDVPPWAPTLATIYWLYGPTRWAEVNWVKRWVRLVPVVNALGDIPAMKLTPMQWDLHRNQRKQTAKGRYGDPIKDSCLNLELSYTKQMMKWAVANKLIKYNPLQAAKAVKTIDHRETWLSTDRIDRLLAAADDVVDKRKADGEDSGLRAKVLKAFILVAHDSMLRMSEARGLRRDRIGPDGRVELAARETKSKKRRTIFLTPRALEAIKALPVDPRTPYVFADGGTQIHNRRLSYWFRRCCELAGVDAYAAPGERQVRPHDLRASGASTADENGARATAIRDALGHAEIGTTAKYLRSEQRDNALSVAHVMIDATEPRRGPRRSVSRAQRKYAVVTREA